jgi:hypothetical protein
LAFLGFWSFFPVLVFFAAAIISVLIQGRVPFSTYLLCPPPKCFRGFMVLSFFAGTNFLPLVFFISFPFS